MFARVSFNLLQSFYLEIFFSLTPCSLRDLFSQRNWNVLWVPSVSKQIYHIAAYDRASPTSQPPPLHNIVSESLRSKMRNTGADASFLIDNCYCSVPFPVRLNKQRWDDVTHPSLPLLPVI